MNLKQMSLCTESLIALAILLFLVLSCANARAQTMQQEKCLVTGTVFDTQDAVVSGARVLFTDRSVTKTANADQEGRYQVELLPGPYEVLIARGMDFWNYMRSKIRVVCDSNEHFNLYVMGECVSYGCGRLGAHFDVLEGLPNLSENPKLVISYFDRKRRGPEVVYSDVVLTFDNYTVLAREVMLNKDKKKLVARYGWFESGVSRERFEVKSIAFADSILTKGFESRTVQDEKNVRNLRKLYAEFVRLGSLK